MKDATEAITSDIMKRTQSENLLDQIKELSPSDFNSLLISYYQSTCLNYSPARLLRNFTSNRFAAPSDINPIAYHTLEIELLSLAEQHEIRPVLLSTAAPLGSASVLSGGSQNRIVSATRGTEILSDATNVLTLQMIAELKRSSKNAKITLGHKQEIHLCSTDRIVRAQQFKGAAQLSQFGLFSFVSSGKDTGSYMCEKLLLHKQLSFYKYYLHDLKKGHTSIVVNRRKGYPDNAGFFERIQYVFKNLWPDAVFMIDEAKEDNTYYQGLNFKIYLEKENQRFEIGDGGFVDWTQQLLQNKKERLLISAISLDRILSLMGVESES